MLASRFEQAAQTLIQLARVAQDRIVLRDAFFDLGRVYTERLPDLRRAEIAFARAVALDPEDVEAAERLMLVFRERREHDKALQVCERLLELAQSDETSASGAAWSSPRSWRTWATAAAPSARWTRSASALRRRPRSSRRWPIFTCARATRSRWRMPAFDRSAHALRAALAQQPSDAPRWSALYELLVRRGRNDAAACAAAFARDLGFGDERAQESRRAAPRPGRCCVRSGLADRLWPEPLDPKARALLRWLEPVADELLGAPQLQRIERVPEALRDAIALVRSALGMSRLEVLQCTEPGCIPLRKDPCTIAISAGVLARSGTHELVFLLLRAVAVAQLGLVAAMRATPGDLAALISAARTLDAAQDAEEDDDPGRAELRKRLATQLNPKRKDELQALAKQLGRHDLPLAALAREIGARVAILATGALGPALRGLLACTPDASSVDAAAFGPMSALERSPDARALLRFALSDAYQDLQRRARESVRPVEG